ncbi:MAG: HAD family phosphatase [Firmicutes bacterium]|nr:HAD family phosphatase [Bacillota bacterium]
MALEDEVQDLNLNYRLLALDIDGTLLNSKSELTARTKAAIFSAKERGLKVVLATGRRLGSTLPFAEALGLDELVIVHNGALVYDLFSGRTLIQRGIDLAAAQEIVDKLDSLGINYVVYTGDSAGERVIAAQGSWDEPENLLGYYLGEEAEFLEKVNLEASPMRISLIDRADKIDALYVEFAASFGGKVNGMLFGSKGDTWKGIEIIPADCNKGTGLALAAERLGLEAKHVVAIGDNVNDIEMITWAGLGVAMANGSQELKQKAKRIAPHCDEDGAAQFIEELLA